MNEVDPGGNWFYDEGVRRIRGGKNIGQLALNANATFSNEPEFVGGNVQGDYGAFTCKEPNLNCFTENTTLTSVIRFTAINRTSKMDKPNSIGPNLGDLSNFWGLHLTNSKAHSGRFSIQMDANAFTGDLFHKDSAGIRGGFNLKPGKYILSAWVAAEGNTVLPTTTSFKNNTYVNIVINNKTFGFSPSGNILDGWQRIYGEFDVPENVTIAKLRFGGTQCYFDDLRIHPFNANMKSFVYDPVTLRLVAELDENNYPTYYEYDKAGNLSHVKKVTEKGVQTVKEVRAGTVKNPN